MRVVSTTDGKFVGKDVHFDENGNIVLPSEDAMVVEQTIITSMGNTVFRNSNYQIEVQGS